MFEVFEFMASLGIVIGVIVGFSAIIPGVYGLAESQPIHNAVDIFRPKQGLDSFFKVRMLCLMVLGLAIILASVLVIVEALVWAAEVVFAVVGVALLWGSWRVTRKPGKIILAIFGVVILMQPLYWAYVLTSKGGL